jgi:hypothetical protein
MVLRSSIELEVIEQSEPFDGRRSAVMFRRLPRNLRNGWGKFGVRTIDRKGTDLGDLDAEPFQARLLAFDGTARVIDGSASRFTCEPEFFGRFDPISWGDEPSHLVVLLTRSGRSRFALKPPTRESGAVLAMSHHMGGRRTLTALYPQPITTGSFLDANLFAATSNLNVSALSLFRDVVRDWEEHEYGIVEYIVERLEELSLKHAWYRDWVEEALPSLLAGVNKDRLLGSLRTHTALLLRSGVRRLCAGHSSTRLIRRLCQLVHVIAPHAPPFVGVITVE